MAPEVPRARAVDSALPLTFLRAAGRGAAREHRVADESFLLRGKHLLPDYSDFSTREASAFIGLTSELRTRWKNRDHWRIWSRMIEEKWEDETLVENLRRDMIALRDDIHRQARRLVVVVMPELSDVHESDLFGDPRMAGLYFRM